jgi:pyridoxal phosphate enzyme (YggS family)
MSAIADKLQAVRGRILAAEKAAGRPAGSVRLIAVGKGFPASSIVEAIDAGHLDFGESYVREAVDKIAAVRLERPDAKLAWSFIGPIQSNKTRAIAGHFDSAHGVDRAAIARRLSEQRPSALPALDVLIQVNISGEATKGGVAPEEVGALASEIAALPRLRLRGLMAIPAPAESVDDQRRAFSAVRQAASEIEAAGVEHPELSMGMSADLEAAIAEGATIVRIGTAIFGQRQTTKIALE